MDWLTPIAVVSIAIFSAEWAFVVWQNRQFSKVYSKMDETVDRILKKLEYHEKHDDRRFTEISNRFSEMSDSIWMLRLRNATREGLLRENTWQDKEKKPSSVQSERNGDS